MKLLYILASVVLATSAQNLATQPCNYGVQARKEWRELSKDEKSAYLSTLKQLQTRSNGQESFYDSLVRMHMDNARPVHGYPQFLPWHRYYLLKLERELQSRARRAIFLPYWDWNRDSQAPEAGSIWGDDPLSFGRNGGSNGCVTTGAFANSQVLYPERRCLQRSWSGRNRLGAFISKESLDASLSRSNTFDAARSFLEGPHGSVHVAIGGDMARMNSPNDPVFFMHHTNVDRQWNRWQILKPNLAATYNGRNVDGTPALATDKLLPHPAIVSDVFDTRKLCYTYPANQQNGAKEGFFDTIDDKALVGYIRKLQAKAPNSNLPDAYDRGDLFDLHTPDPLPEEWLSMNNMDVATYREYEKQVREDIIYRNGLNELSYSALWSDSELLERLLLLFSLEGKEFEIKVGGKSVSVRINPDGGAEWLVRFRDEIRQMLMMLASGQIN